MCQNQTIGVDSASGHSFGCADSGASKGCTTTLGIKTCICEGTLCNEYSSAFLYRLHLSQFCLPFWFQDLPLCFKYYSQ